jgi:hypothetical protein
MKSQEITLKIFSISRCQMDSKLNCCPRITGKSNSLDKMPNTWRALEMMLLKTDLGVCDAFNEVNRTDKGVADTIVVVE